MVAIRQNGQQQETPEKSISDIKEAVEDATGAGLGAIVILCVIASFIIVGIVGGIVFGFTSALAYLWNISVAPLGTSTVTWWQVAGVWIIASCIRHFLKKIFQK